jgi:hypothetical protein
MRPDEPVKKKKASQKKIQVRGRGGIQYTNTTHRLKHTTLLTKHKRQKKQKNKKIANITGSDEYVCKTSASMRSVTSDVSR